jgi:hypothetical protein
MTIAEKIMQILKEAAEAEKIKHTYVNPHFLDELQSSLYAYENLEDDEVSKYIEEMFGA